MSSVKLYVYDLTNGMARQLSVQLTGRQMDGIWHTSVVVFGKEIFYGRGIMITQPGHSHHGQPLQILDMGETALDEETFNDYLAEMRTHYTADKYHLLDFNCNSFTDDCVGFLTGGSIPPFIKDLPNDFLSTPLGAALRPTIDAMFRGPSPATVSTPATTGPSQGAGSILQTVASRAQANPGAPPSRETSSLTGPLHIITNSATFNHFLKSHRAVVALFTAPQTCPPCRVIEPVFNQLAEDKGIREGKPGAAFAKIDINVGNGRVLAGEWGIRATPTFMFFLDGKKIDEMKGANANELRTQVDLLLFQAFPPHPHTSLSLPAVDSLSLKPILFSQVPALDSVLAKQMSLIDDQSWPDGAQPKDQVKSAMTEVVTSYLKPKFPSAGAADKQTNTDNSSKILAAWSQATMTIATILPIESLFPMADLWRLAFLDTNVGTWVTSLQTPSNTIDPLNIFLSKTNLALDSPAKGARNFSFIVLRLLCNSLSHPVLAKRLLLSEMRQKVTATLIASLLHPDATVRMASASLAFNIAAVVQKERVDAVKSGRSGHTDSETDLGDWEVEVVTAVAEALDREKENEEVVHRLTASLAFFLRLSPHYETQIRPLLEVLHTRQTLKDKLNKGNGWTKDGGITKKDVRKLVEEVADKLCF